MKVIIFLILIVIVVVLFFIARNRTLTSSIRKKTNDKSNAYSSFHRHTSEHSHPLGEIPTWLLNAINKFQQAAMSYAFYELSLNDDALIAQKARDEFEKTDVKVYAPPPLLLNEIRKEQDCSCDKLDFFLCFYYQKETGKEISNAHVQQTVEDFLIAQAKKKAFEICSVLTDEK